MTTAPELIAAIEDFGLEPEAYSGRGMNGSECVSVIIEEVSDIWLLASFFRGAGLDVGPPCTDNMGRDYVAYWPAMAWAKSDRTGV